MPPPSSASSPPPKNHNVFSGPSTFASASRNQSSTSISSEPFGTAERPRRNLRYEAYDPPPTSSLRPPSRVRRYQMSERSYSSLSTRSASVASTGSRGLGVRFPNERPSDSLDRTVTMTAGELALIGGKEENRVSFITCCT